MFVGCFLFVFGWVEGGVFCMAWFFLWGGFVVFFLFFLWVFCLLGEGFVVAVGVYVGLLWFCSDEFELSVRCCVCWLCCFFVCCCCSVGRYGLGPHRALGRCCGVFVCVGCLLCICHFRRMGLAGPHH